MTRRSREVTPSFDLPKGFVFTQADAALIEIVGLFEHVRQR